MRRIIRLTFDETNTYLVIGDGEAFLVDAGAPVELVEESLVGVRLEYILLTHAHPRHVRFLPDIRSKLGGRICIHNDDLQLLRKSIGKVEPDIHLRHMHKLEVGGLRITVHHTPGHTLGSACYEIPESKVVFTGDTLLKGGYGRIAGPHSMSMMVISLKNISKIPPETIVYPGHGPETRIRDETWLDGLDMLS